MAAPQLVSEPAPRRELVRIDRFARVVFADDGSIVRYDKLIIATGSRTFFPRRLISKATIDARSMPDRCHCQSTD
jgi:NAD(P)H-nitrite reductase large subunit